MALRIIVHPAHHSSVTYFITFSSYGTRLHGDESGSVDRHHNVPGTPLLDPDRSRESSQRAKMSQPAYQMDTRRRDMVLAAIREVCDFRHWTLLAAHVRSNHVHVVVDTDAEAEAVLGAFKAYASRALNRAGIDAPGRRRWTRHGSTRYLRGRKQIEAALIYVADEQGRPTALYVNEDR